MDYYVFLLITLAITIGSQAYLNSTTKKCENIAAKKELRGEKIARKILDENHLKKVSIESNNGYLSDYYDPRRKVVSLSSAVYADSTIAAVSVAAHECGHAIQDKDGYLFLRVRRTILPLINFASKAGYIAILIGIFAGITKFLWLGIICETLIMTFQLITLPVEFNASKRGLKQLIELKLIEKDEIAPCKKMLTAAALTYVASVATSAIEILRLVLMARRRD